MNRKWIGFAVAAALVAASASASGLSRAQDQEKHKEKEDRPWARSWRRSRSSTSPSPRRPGTPRAFKKGQKDVEKAASELAKLAKDSKPLKDAVPEERQERGRSREEVG